jgi:Ca2+/Na+ antiporter
MIFNISLPELKRRKIAFSSLAASLYLCFILASVILNYSISVTAYIVFALFLLAMIAVFFWYFRYLATLNFALTDRALQRTISKKTETYLLADITGFRLILRTDKTIRGIHLAFRNGKKIYVNALENPEVLNNELTNKLGKGVAAREEHEPLAFDHILFYPVLGIILGFFCAFVLKSVAAINGSGAQYLLCGLLIFIGAVGLYFILAKPMSGNSNVKTRLWDYGFGLLLVAIAVIIFLIKT